MTLSSRLAARGLGADYKPIRGAEAFMAGELDDAHLLAEHRAACDEIKRLRAGIIKAIEYGENAPERASVVLDRIVELLHELVSVPDALYRREDGSVTDRCARCGEPVPPYDVEDMQVCEPCDEIVRLQGENEQLREAIRKHGTHVGLCGARMRGSDCGCGPECLTA